jgi:hypothetical protein
MYSRYGGGYSYSSNGPGFFEFLFGGGRDYYEPPPQRHYRPRGFIGPRANNNGNYTWR